MPNQPAIARADVVIAGGGFAGLALALALRQSLGSAFKVVVADPAFCRQCTARPARVGDRSRARRMFETLGVWDAVAADAQPILDMVVTDSKLKDAVRPVFLTFAGEVEAGEPFAHMIENAPLNAALAATACEQGIDSARDDGDALRASGWTDRSGARRRNGDFCVAARLPQTVRAQACASRPASRRMDGRTGSRRSSPRFRMSATTTAAPKNTSCPVGPFAILPLTGRRSSLVWTETDCGGRAHRSRCPTRRFTPSWNAASGLHLGEIGVVAARRAYPLGLFIARAFIAERIALVGDAAHVIHPIAGQGLNMGLRDIAALAEAIADAARLGLDIGGADVLDRYQRWRRFDTMAMGVATDGLNRLFSNQSDVLRLMRDVGLGLVDRMPALKSFFIARPPASPARCRSCCAARRCSAAGRAKAHRAVPA
jgi:2-octaprenyl-6-methoxyphenol hydroxylase